MKWERIIPLACIIVWFVLCAIQTGGCEQVPSGYSGDPELVAVAEAAPTEAQYGPIPRHISLAWGEQSFAYSDHITINESVRGTPWVRNHVDHEIAEVYAHIVGVDDPALWARLDRDHAINAALAE